MTENNSTGVSRRTLAKGVAWAVPAVAVSAAAPAYAASCVPTLSFGAGSCKCPGQSTGQPWGYYVTICNTGTTCPDIDGFIWVAIRTNTGSNPLLTTTAYQVPVGGCTSVLQFNSTNSSSKLRLTYGDTSAAALAATAPYVIVNSPPDCEGGDLGTCAATAARTAATAEATPSNSAEPTTAPSPEVSTSAAEATPAQAPAETTTSPTPTPTPTPTVAP